MLPGSGDVRHVFIQDVLLGADAIIVNVLGPVQLAHIKVERLKEGGGKDKTTPFHSGLKGNSTRSPDGGIEPLISRCPGNIS